VRELLHPSLTNDDHTRGDPNAPIAVTVFGDYECPVSARLWRVLHEVGRSLSFREAFRHFPLTGVHPHALVAAQAAEAASDQRMFWEMHDRLFERQHALDIPDLETYATDLGLDVERFAEDVAYESFADVVRAHQRSGVSSGVVTTPAVFVNGRRATLDDPDQLSDVLAGTDSARTEAGEE
jgi:formate-nitrite transporter family protein